MENEEIKTQFGYLMHNVEEATGIERNFQCSEQVGRGYTAALNTKFPDNETPVVTIFSLTYYSMSLLMELLQHLPHMRRYPIPEATVPEMPGPAEDNEEEK